MKEEELDRGKKLADKSLAWWGSTMPGFEKDQYIDEPIPLLVKWLKQHGFPELELDPDDTAKANPKARVIVDEIAADNLRNHISYPRRKK